MSTLHESPLQVTCYKRWLELIAFFCMSLFVASGNALELLEPIDETLATIAFWSAWQSNRPLSCAGFLSGGIMAKINQPKAVGYSVSIIEMKKSDSSTPT